MNLKLSWKLALIGISSTVPLLCGTFFLINKYTNKDIRSAKLEQSGIRFLQPLEELLETLPEHQGLLLRSRKGDQAAAKDLVAKQEQVDQAFAALEAVTAELGSGLLNAAQGPGEQPRAGMSQADLKSEWLDLKQKPGRFSVDDLLARHAYLVSEVRGLITHLGNTSGLVLDPELDSYYVMDAMLNALPQTQDRLVLITALGDEFLRQNHLTVAQRLNLAGQARLLQESDLDRITRDVRTALAVDPQTRGTSESLQRNLPAAFQAYAEATGTFAFLIKRTAESEAPTVSAASFSAAGDQARRLSFRLGAILRRELDVLLQKRIDDLNRARSAGLALVALSLLLTVGVTALVARSINRVEQQLLELNATLEQRVAQRTLELEAANKELESFSYSVSHDLRTPLRGIAGFTEALSRNHRSRLDAEGGKYLDRVLAAAERMGHLIDDLLNLSRVGRADLVRRPVDLSAMVRSIAEILQQSAPQRPVEWVIAAGITGEGDSRLLRIVLENLLGNAWKFTAKKPAARIEFGAAPGPDGRSACYVRDNGAGFDLNYATKLFDPFQRMHSLKEFPGTGIGLATVKRIISRHGGQVWAEAKIDAGATIHFTLESLPS